MSDTCTRGKLHDLFRPAAASGRRQLATRAFRRRPDSASSAVPTISSAVMAAARRHRRTSASVRRRLARARDAVGDRVLHNFPSCPVLQNSSRFGTNELGEIATPLAAYSAGARDVVEAAGLPTVDESDSNENSDVENADGDDENGDTTTTTSASDGKSRAGNAVNSATSGSTSSVANSVAAQPPQIPLTLPVKLYKSKSVAPRYTAVSKSQHYKKSELLAYKRSLLEAVEKGDRSLPIFNLSASVTSPRAASPTTSSSTFTSSLPAFSVVPPTPPTPTASNTSLNNNSNNNSAFAASMSSDLGESIDSGLEGAPETPREETEAQYRDVTGARDCVRDMFGNGIPDYLEDDFLQWYEGYIMGAQARSESSRTLLGMLAGDDDGVLAPRSQHQRNSEDENERVATARVSAFVVRESLEAMRICSMRGFSPNHRARVWSLLLDLDARAAADDGGYDRARRVGAMKQRGGDSKRIRGGKSSSTSGLASSIPPPTTTLTTTTSTAATAASAARDASAVWPRPTSVLLEHQIMCDVSRTFPDVVAIHADFEPRLATLLRTFAACHTEYSYTQGMNFIAGALLLFFDDRDSFHAMTYIIDDLLPFYYNDGMIGLRADTIVFGQLLHRFLPRLARHFESIGLSLLLVTCQWFSTLFVKTLPLETAFRIWDMIFAGEGIATVFEFGLRILALFQTQLMSHSDDIDLICALTSLCEALFNFDLLLQAKALHGVKMLSRQHLQLARVRVRKQLQANRPPPTTQSNRS